MRRALALGGAALALVLALVARSSAAGDLPMAAGSGPHGGKVHRAGDLSFELVFGSDELRIYITDKDGRPIAAEGKTARADIAVLRTTEGHPWRGNQQAASSTLRWVGADAHAGRLRGALVGSHNLGEAARQVVRIDIGLDGAPGDVPVGFRAELTGTTPEVRYGCAKAGCSDARYFDPGECHTCHGTLVRLGEDGRPAADPARPPRRPLRPRR